MGIKRFIRYITAIILIASALFIFLSFLSYSPNDPPFADYPGNNPVHNFCGIAGAQIAGYALAGLGRASYLIVVLVAWLGVVYLFKENIEHLWVKMIGSVLLLFSLASLLTLGCYAFKKSLLSANVGGIFGIVVVSRLYEYFNLTGTIIILASGLVVSFILLLNVTPVSPFVKVSKAKEESPVSTHDSENEGANLRYHAKINTLNNSTISTNNHRDAIPADVTGETKNGQAVSLGTLKEIQEQFDGEQCLEDEDTAIYAETIKQKKHDYDLPPVDLLEKPAVDQHSDDWDQITQRAQVLKNTLVQFNVNAEVVEIARGPVIAMYELELAPGTKVGKVVSLSDDLAIALKAPSVRVIAPLPGKSSIGLEVPNTKRKTVMLRELLETSDDMRGKMAIPLLIGKDAAGNPLISDLASMPHLLIAGTTGSGKSVCLNSIILSILFMRYPSEVQLLLVDPKMVEFSLFKEIPHLISPVVTDMKKAAAVLEWAVNKMEERYALLASVGVKHINGYNKLGASEIKKRLNP